MHLKSLIEEHCLGEGNKVLIFVARLFTARYLADKLEYLFLNQLNIGCTVDPGRLQPQLKNAKQRAEVLKMFSPRSHKYKPSTEYDILICTDADGIGVNLQDANVLVHYDPPFGADTLFQRVGRILRMTNDPNRVLYIYTFVPSLIDQKADASRVHQDVYDIFDRITHRHDASRQILGAGVLSRDEDAEMTLDDEWDIAQLARDSELLKDVGGIGVESRLRHIAMLEKQYERATQIPHYLQSARASIGPHSLMFVLVEYEGKYYPIVYNLTKQSMEELRDFEVLDQIFCTEEEPRASIPVDAIEHLASLAVRIWCKNKTIDVDHVDKICAMILVPQGKAHEIANLFKSAQLLEKIFE